METFVGLHVRAKGYMIIVLLYIVTVSGLNIDVIPETYVKVSQDLRINATITGFVSTEQAAWGHEDETRIFTMINGGVWSAGSDYNASKHSTWTINTDNDDRYDLIIPNVEIREHNGVYYCWSLSEETDPGSEYSVVVIATPMDGDDDDDDVKLYSDVEGNIFQEDSHHNITCKAYRMHPIAMLSLTLDAVPLTDVYDPVKNSDGTFNSTLTYQYIADAKDGMFECVADQGINLYTHPISRTLTIIVEVQQYKWWCWLLIVIGIIILFGIIILIVYLIKKYCWNKCRQVDDESSTTSDIRKSKENVNNPKVV